MRRGEAREQRMEWRLEGGRSVRGAGEKERRKEEEVGKKQVGREEAAGCCSDLAMRQEARQGSAG